MKHLTLSQWAWLGGLTDAEGCIGCYDSRATYVISNTSHPLLEYVKKVLGVGGIGSGRQLSNKHKPVRHYRITVPPDVKAILEGIRPFTPIKNRQVVAVLGYLNSSRTPELISNVPTTLAALNARGKKAIEPPRHVELTDLWHQHKYEYLGGLFDGDGTYAIEPGGHVKVRISLTDHSALMTIAQAFDLGRLRYTSFNTPNNRSQIVWEIYSQERQEFLSNIYPHSVIKKQQISNCYEYSMAATVRRRKGELRWENLELNRRGPALAEI